MLNRITIVPRNNVESLISSDTIPNFDWYLISIHGDSKKLLTDQNIKTLKNKNCIDMISLEFWDITELNYPSIKEHYPQAILFNEDHAKQIIDFIDKIKDKDGALIIHCDAGISRSGAVGTFANDYLRVMEYERFLRHNRNINPNPYILRMLRNLSGLNKLIGQK